VSSGPVEAKVIAAAAGAGAGGILSAFVLWLLNTYAFADHHTPAPVAAVVQLTVTVALAFAGGWNAPHTLRPDLGTSAAAAKP
jgi:hypothetical protein